VFVTVVLAQSYDDSAIHCRPTLCTSSFVDGVMFSHGANGPESDNTCLVVFTRWRLRARGRRLPSPTACCFIYICCEILKLFMFCGVQLIQQLRGQVSELQLALCHKDMELQERDRRIRELENQLRLLSSDLSVRLPLTTLS